MEDLSEQIISQYQKYISILSKVCNKESVEMVAEHFGERLVLSPRGLKDLEGGNPGELISFSLRVATAIKSLSSQMSASTKSLVKVSLLHELGRLGDLEESLYLEQDSDWHRERLGQNYKYNEKCSKMGVAHRTLWLLNHFGIKLTRDEYLAILTSQGLHLNENQFYGYDSVKNPTIIALQAARGIIFSEA